MLPGGQGLSPWELFPRRGGCSGRWIGFCTWRPVGTVGLIGWMSAVFIGELPTMLNPHVPAPTPTTRHAPLWVSSNRMHELLALEVEEVRVGRTRGTGAASPLRRGFATS